MKSLESASLSRHDVIPDCESTVECASKVKKIRDDADSSSSVLPASTSPGGVTRPNPSVETPNDFDADQIRQPQPQQQPQPQPQREKHSALGAQIAVDNNSSYDLLGDLMGLTPRAAPSNTRIKESPQIILTATKGTTSSNTSTTTTVTNKASVLSELMGFGGNKSTKQSNKTIKESALNAASVLPDHVTDSSQQTKDGKKNRLLETTAVPSTSKSPGQAKAKNKVIFIIVWL